MGEKKTKRKVLSLASLILEGIYIKNAVDVFCAVSGKNLSSFGIYDLPFFVVFSSPAPPTSPYSQALSFQMTPRSCSPLRLATTDNTSDGSPRSPGSRCTRAEISNAGGARGGMVCLYSGGSLLHDPCRGDLQRFSVSSRAGELLEDDKSIYSR